jgi:hypothetical protein
MEALLLQTNNYNYGKHLLRKALWINVAFAKLIAFGSLFLSGKWVAIDDLTNGQGTILRMNS